jgi:hypothetical protein
MKEKSDGLMEIEISEITYEELKGIWEEGNFEDLDSTIRFLIDKWLHKKIK